MRVSPSQLKTFAHCPRQWAYDRITQRSPQTRAQKLGDEIQDGYLDPYLQHGTIPSLKTEAGRIAFSGLRHLPRPGPENKIERPFVLDGPDGFEFVGRMDCWRPQDYLVVDHKTVYSLSERVPSPLAFAVDFQRIIYAAFAADWGGKSVATRWVYYQTTKPFRSECLPMLEDPEEIADNLNHVIMPMARRLQVVRDRPPCSQERNLQGCTAPYRCRHITRCYTEDPPNMGIIDEIKARAAAKNAAVQPAPAPAAPEEQDSGGGADAPSRMDSAGEELKVPRTSRKKAPPKPEELGNSLDRTVRALLTKALGAALASIKEE